MGDDLLGQVVHLHRSATLKPPRRDTVERASLALFKRGEREPSDETIAETKFTCADDA